MTEPTQSSLSSRAKRGGMWVVLRQGFDFGARLVSNIVLAWLLFPEDFGVLVPVSVFMVGMTLFSDIGIGPSVIVSPRGEDPAFMRTVWTVQVFRGFFLCGVCWALAGPYSRLIAEEVTSTGMREQDVVYTLVLIIGLSPLCDGFRSLLWFTADRRIAQGRKTLIQILSKVISLVTTITWAWIARSPVALVGGRVVYSLCETLLSHLLLPGIRMGFRLEKKALRELFGFGRWIFLSTALFFLASQVDRVIISDLLEAGPRGIFRIGSVMAALVPGALAAVSAAVVFPSWMKAFRVKDGGYAQRVLRSRQTLLSIGIAGVVGVVTIVPFFLQVLYADRYQGAASIAQLLCIAYWFESLRASATSALLVHGDSRALSGSNFMILIVKVPACWYGFQIYGLEGFLLGIALGNLAGLLRLHQRLRSHGIHLFFQDLRGTLLVALFGGTGYLVAEYAIKLPLPEGLLIAGGSVLGLSTIALRPAYALLLRRST
jgi:O-antigen/teichoic acid export membrane protein